MADGDYGSGAYGAGLYGIGESSDAFERALQRFRDPGGKFYERPDPYGTQAHLKPPKPPLLASKVPVGF